MTQIVVTLDKDADGNFLRRVIENIKGVVQTSFLHSEEKQDTENSHFLDSLHEIKKSIDPSVIDMSDPHTNYIMSK